MNMDIAQFHPVNTFAKLTASDFRNGTIEVKVLSRLLADAPYHPCGYRWRVPL